MPNRPIRVLKFTDTFADINGVCRFIQNIAHSAHQSNKDLAVFTSTRLEMPAVEENVVNFKPVLAMRMPGYHTLDLAIPPLLAMLRATDEFRPDVIHISTPGPVGMVGMLAAKLMGVPVVGVYHTDFPAYIDELFDSRLASRACRAFMGGFYKQFRCVFSRSVEYASRLESMGIAQHKLVWLKPGFDHTKFNPALRNAAIWEAHGIEPDSIKVLFCGRVSTEKNMPMLESIWPDVVRQAQAAGKRVDLIIIGDGPYRDKMASGLKGQRVHFLGFRNGIELARLYSSCDLFVFPSTTDTLGQVVMESQASGLPAIVTDQGGPKEVVEDQKTGVVLPFDAHGLWVETIVGLVIDDERRKAMGQAGIEAMKHYAFDQSFEHYWQVHERVGIVNRWFEKA